ncbi:MULTISPECIES: hypothetical protein [unclassified Providencia]|uniref:hypothetical protein n=1 Tax=unclassified Providencia TaxID=2633465 RepID=UPI00234BFAEE|nr:MULTISPECIES: hypothetical protein [unclassified Providencia]
MNKITYLYLCLILTSTIPHVANAETTTAKSDSQSNVQTSELSSQSEKLALMKNNESDVLTLNSLVNEQKQQILHLQEKINKIEDSSGLNFAIWSGILLTSVAVILTALGIVMAVFSFFGYKKMINSAKESATKISTEKASEVTEKLAPEVTESVLLKLMDQGNFDTLIFEAVQKVTYRGIAFSSGDMLEDSNQGNLK